MTAPEGMRRFEYWKRLKDVKFVNMNRIMDWEDWNRKNPGIVPKCPPTSEFKIRNGGIEIYEIFIRKKAN